MEIFNRELEKITFTVWAKIIIIGLLFANEDVFIFGVWDNLVFRNVPTIIQLIGLVYFIFNIRYVKKDGNFLSLFFLSFIILFTCVVNCDLRFGYLFFVVLFINCFLCLNIYCLDDILELFYKVMYFISLYSLLFYCVRMLFPLLLKFFPVIRNVANIDFYFCGLCNVIINHGGLLRNYGPFREPGVFQMFIIIALTFGLFKRKKMVFSELICLIVALCTTFSTTGYICLFFLMTGFFFHKNSFNKYIRHGVLIFVLIGAFYLTFYTDLLYKEGYGSVFGKMLGAYNSISMIAREASITVNLKMFLNKPIFGNGLTYVDNNFSFFAFQIYGLATKDNTNTLLIQLSRFGLMFALIYVVRFIVNLWNYFDINVVSKLCIIISFFALLCGENLSYSFMVSMFLFVPIYHYDESRYKTVNCVQENLNKEMIK